MDIAFKVGFFYAASTSFHKYDQPKIFKCCKRTDKSVWLQEVQSRFRSPIRIKIHVGPEFERATYDRWSIYSNRLATDKDFIAANLLSPTNS